MSEQSLVERLRKFSERAAYQTVSDITKEAAERIAALEAQLSKSEPVPAAWDEWALDKSREMVRQMEEVPHPRAQLVARLHCLLVEAMEFAAPVADNTAGEDAARLDWMQRKLTGASDSARYLPFRVYWGQSKNIRAAIDKARGVQQEGGKAE